MDILAQLGVALGLASLAGVNLYLTVLLTGLAVRFDWVQLGAQFQSLEVLAHPLVIVVAGLLFLLQFCADKIPWVDSLWDSVHTIIRPVGGTLLALQALGDMPGYVKVAAALLAGGAALTMHGAKAGTRLFINQSPEPVTNVAMSLAEEAAVAGGVALVLLNPVVALAVFVGLLTLIWLLLPKVWRLIRTTLWLVWHKLKLPGRRQGAEAPVELGREFSDELRDLIRIRAGLTEDDVAWTVRCVSGKTKGIRGFGANRTGVLLAPVRPDCLYFAVVKGLRSRFFRVPLESPTIENESRFLSENVNISSVGARAVFRFPRGQGALAEAVAARVRESVLKAGVSAEESRESRDARKARPGPIRIPLPTAMAAGSSSPAAGDSKSAAAETPAPEGGVAVGAPQAVGSGGHGLAAAVVGSSPRPEGEGDSKLGPVPAVG